MPNVYRSALVNLGDLTTYDSVKRFFVNNWNFPDTYWTHALCRYGYYRKIFFCMFLCYFLFYDFDTYSYFLVKVVLNFSVYHIFI